MRSLVVLAVLVCVAPALAAPGDSWILPIDHTLGGGFTPSHGAGYAGGAAIDASGPDAVRRVYWQTNNVIPVGGAPAAMPTTTELYTIQFYGPTIPPASGGTDWQPIDSQFNGSAGETWPMEPGIPWNGMFGTNHQYIGSDGALDAVWHATGPGPHTPESAAPDAGANGIYMWLQGGTSWLYAKWDYPWSIHRSWSAIELTQVTPEPTTLGVLALMSPLVLMRRRRAA